MINKEKNTIILFYIIFINIVLAQYLLIFREAEKKTKKKNLKYDIFYTYIA